MHTSYFFSKKIYTETMNLVAISRSVPKFLQGRVRIYEPLCPPWALVAKYKRKEIAEADYEQEYTATVLNKLDPLTVYEQMGDDAVLLCWEQPGKFCHRHIVANWLSTHLNLSVTEL